jgi:hypothetical protein
MRQELLHMRGMEMQVARLKLSACVYQHVSEYKIVLYCMVLSRRRSTVTCTCPNQAKIGYAGLTDKTK